ncbi:uncharacterized protein MYCGRDRAFT_89703 [Zymoseptoria tritici IPO323]|uniref:Uncharacterized protein n=1 Tax=Zymoseptoria tritici (strain CBS 115943 / IPO323) TaxID=336722 RepID=F9X178_ZYMTI|nr:uncharacterized protein MYCGRDRAFT_89703 [Zymoseptoria tritici IPO323]EGP92171.1 hypothetical protein MYCGRDRAFT_89703 [Zymoseptoria tritici IPO323]
MKQPERQAQFEAMEMENAELKKDIADVEAGIAETRKVIAENQQKYAGHVVEGGFYVPDIFKHHLDALELSAGGHVAKLVTVMEKMVRAFKHWDTTMKDPKYRAGLKQAFTYYQTSLDGVGLPKDEEDGQEIPSDQHDAHKLYATDALGILANCSGLFDQEAMKVEGSGDEDDGLLDIQDKELEDESAVDEKNLAKKPRDLKPRDPKAHDQKAHDQKARDQKAHDQKARDQRAPKGKAREEQESSNPAIKGEDYDSYDFLIPTAESETPVKTGPFSLKQRVNPVKAVGSKKDPSDILLLPNAGESEEGKPVKRKSRTAPKADGRKPARAPETPKVSNVLDRRASTPPMNRDRPVSAQPRSGTRGGQKSSGGQVSPPKEEKGAKRGSNAVDAPETPASKKSKTAVGAPETPASKKSSNAAGGRTPKKRAPKSRETVEEEDPDAEEGNIAALTPAEQEFAAKMGLKTTADWWTVFDKRSAPFDLDDTTGIAKMVQAGWHEVHFPTDPQRRHKPPPVEVLRAAQKAARVHRTLIEDSLFYKNWREKQISGSRGTVKTLPDSPSLEEHMAREKEEKQARRRSRKEKRANVDGDADGDGDGGAELEPAPAKRLKSKGVAARLSREELDSFDNW